jgi:hypothetical protein
MSATTFTPVSREQLWGLLAEAAEIEHHLMCCCTSTPSSA